MIDRAPSMLVMLALIGCGAEATRVEVPTYPTVQGLYEVLFTSKYQNLDGDPPTWTNAIGCLAGFRIPTQSGPQFTGTFFENSSEITHCRLLTHLVSGTVDADGLLTFSIEDIAPRMSGCSVVGDAMPFIGVMDDEDLFAYRLVQISCEAGSDLSVYGGSGEPVPNGLLYQEIFGIRGPL